MISIADMRKAATQHLMQLEMVLVDVYTNATIGLTDFLLFDGGAHKGFHTTRMAGLNGCGFVIAVEADPFMAEVLRKNLEQQIGGRASIVRVVQKALQKDPLAVSVPWKSSISHVGRSSIKTDIAGFETIWVSNRDIEYREEFAVPATTIDALVSSEIAPLPFIKLDLEGADLAALFGASRTLDGKRPIVAFENSINAPKVHGFSVEEAIAFFDQHDYVPLNFLGERLSVNDWFSFFEAWAVPREKLDWISSILPESITKRIQ